MVIDPGLGVINPDRDTMLDGSTVNGSVGIVSWSDDERLLFGFDISSLPNGSDIISSSLEFNIYQNRTSSDAAFTAYKVTSDWEENYATWTVAKNGANWTTAGGDYDSSVASDRLVIPYDFEGDFQDLYISNILNSHLDDSEDDVKTKGILLKRDQSADTDAIRIYTNDGSVTSKRPKLYVNYDYETATFSDLLSPVPDNQYAPVKFDGKWYTYITGGQYNSNNDQIPKTFAIQINDDDKGMATRDISNISDYMYRNVGTQTPSPQATGTPFPVLEPLAHQEDFITPTPGDWYVRMNALFSHNVGANASSTPIIHSVFHAEDTHDYGGRPYGIYQYPSNPNIWLHANYARIGYARSENAVDFDIVSMKPEMTTTPTPRQQRTPGPLIECFMSETDWLYPEGTPGPGTPIPEPTYDNWFDTDTPPQHGVGVRHPWLIEKDNYLYVFYDRNLSLQYCEARDTDGELEYDLLQAATRGMVQWPSSICVARALKTSVNSYDSSTDSPWKKFFIPPVSPTPSFGQPANGGWSTPLFLPSTTNKYRELPSVTKSKYLSDEPYILLSRGIDNGKYYLYIAKSLNNDLTQWSTEMRFDIQDDYANTPDNKYVSSFLINNDPSECDLGSAVECGQEAYLYMGLGDLNGMPRTKFRFTQWW